MSVFYLLLLFTIVSCTENTGVENSSNEPSKKSSKSSLEPIKIDPQVTFDQSQFNTKVDALCFKFRNMDGRDRKDIFNLFEAILPSCPLKQIAGNKTKADVDNAQQIMTINDLKEILGRPSEIREDGMIVYHLMADESYRVLFQVELNGSVACRFYEADS